MGLPRDSIGGSDRHLKCSVSASGGLGLVGDRPVHKDALECSSLGQANGVVLLRVAQRQLRCAQHWRMREIELVIGKGAELDHGAMLPQASAEPQSKVPPHGGPRQMLTQR